MEARVHGAYAQRRGRGGGERGGEQKNQKNRKEKEGVEPGSSGRIYARTAAKGGATTSERIGSIARSGRATPVAFARLSRRESGPARRRSPRCAPRFFRDAPWRLAPTRHRCGKRARTGRPCARRPRRPP